MPVVIERCFSVTPRGVIEHRYICFQDENDACTGLGCGQKVMPAIALKEFFELERTRATEIYYPLAPYTLRFIESHVPPLPEEEINSLEQAMSVVNRVKRKISDN